MSSWSRFLRNLQSDASRLDSPEVKQEQLRQDLDPRNFALIDQEIARNPAAAEILGAERRRLEELHKAMLMKQTQTFPMRLQQQLQPPPVYNQRLPMINGSPVQNPYPSRLPPPIIGGVRD